jgi:hypothetical protein
MNEILAMLGKSPWALLTLKRRIERGDTMAYKVPK